jgi:propionyl-CoA carboxylase alpha chain
MLAKIISYAPTRDEAIDILANGLDSYVIEGVQHNARLCNAVLRHPAFRAGNTPTSFLPTHIPKFEGVQLTEGQEGELAVAVALIAKARESIFEHPPVAGNSPEVVVRLGGLFGKAFSVKLGDGRATVLELADEGDFIKREIAIDSVVVDTDNCLARVSLDGTDRAIQVRETKTDNQIF